MAYRLCHRTSYQPHNVLFFPFFFIITVENSIEYVCLVTVVRAPVLIHRIDTTFAWWFVVTFGDASMLYAQRLLMHIPEHMNSCTFFQHPSIVRRCFHDLNTIKYSTLPFNCKSKDDGNSLVTTCFPIFRRSSKH